MHYYIKLFLIVFLLHGCKNSADNTEENSNSNHYAHGFKIEKNTAITKLTVFDPWEKAKNITVEYFLINKNMSVPDSVMGQKIIKTPVKRVICLSTTHIAFLDVLDETGTIVGISGSNYVSNKKILNRIKHGKIPDVGYGQNLDYEMIVTQSPDLVFVYGIGSEVTGYIKKLEELDIPVIMVAEYLEETPLGKAEWIKFFSAFFEKENNAYKFFNNIEEEYIQLKNHVQTKNIKPKVLVGSPYKDSWWVPGGESYMANLISDAGGLYMGKKNSLKESYVISFENALAWGSEAEIWINMGNMTSKDEIIAADERFKKLKVFNEGKIFNNINKLTTKGGNDFWESGTVNPHIILKDLITIFHPDLVDQEMIYYKEIK